MRVIHAIGNTEMMKALISLLLMLFSVATAKNLNNKVDHLSEENNFNCATLECVESNRNLVQYILKNIKKDVDPCEDFYQYVCGNSRAHNPNRNVGDRSADLKRRKRSSNFSPSDTLNNFMTSCETFNENNQASTPEIEKKNVDDLKKIVSELGGWPILEGSNWNETKFDWTELSTKCNSLGIDTFPFISVETVTEKHWTQFQTIGNPFRPLLSQYIWHPVFITVMQALNKKMQKVAKFLGATSQQAEELNESFEFEIRLIIASLNDNSLRKYNSNDLMSVEEIKAKWPSIDWRKFFSSWPQSHFYATNQRKILVKSPGYITEFEKLVRETPKRVLANYAIRKIVDSLTQFVGSATLTNIEKTYSESIGTQPISPLLDCETVTSKQLSIPMISYYSGVYPLNVYDFVLSHHISFDIKKKFIEIVNGSNKFDSKAKNDIVENFNSLNVIVSQTETTLSAEKLEKYMGELKITNESYLQNHLNLVKFYKRKSDEYTVKTRNSIDITNAFLYFNPDLLASYNYDYNTLIVSPIFSNVIWFGEFFPNYVNYAIFGLIAAHEFGHSIDLLKGKVNIFGDEENGWSAATNAEYKKTGECLIEQFNNYTFKGSNKPLNGTQYLSENIADLVGVKIAYLAYQDFVQKYGVEAPYSNLSHNSNQLFWIMQGSFFCKKSLTETDSIIINHAPYDKRLIGTVSNSPEFVRDFNCPLGSKMNRINKCDLF